MTKEAIKVYSKTCLECHDERWVETRAKLMAEFVVKEYRTALNPIWHKTAKKLADSDDYKPFILFPDGSIKTVKEVEDEKEAQVPKVRRGASKRPRMARVVRKKSKTAKKDEAVK